MRCANPECLCDFLNQPGGTLWFKELEGPREQLSEVEDNGFPMRRRPMKYFWLCVACNERFVISRWTSDGIILLPRHSSVFCGNAGLADTPDPKPPARAKASDGIEITIQSMA
jgi:hypothetical protein